MAPHDIAKIGYLYLRRGEWAGRRLLPRGWVDRAYAAPVDMRLGGLRHANGWWTLPEQRALLAVGFLRQLIVVLPDADVVAVVTGRRSGPLAPLVERIAAAARSETALPPDPAAGVEQRSPVPAASSLAATVSGRTYRIEPNASGIASIRLDLGSAHPRYESTFVPARPGGPVRRSDGPLGLDGLFRVRERHLDHVDPEGRCLRISRIGDASGLFLGRPDA